MNILIYEMKQNRKSQFGWAIGLSGIACLFMAFLPSFMEETDAFMSFIENMGEAFTSALGLELEAFFSPVGFYSYIFMYVLLIGSIQALAAGLHMFSKEIRMKTADFLMTKTKSRSRIFVEKYLSAAVGLIITQAIYYGLTSLMMKITVNQETDLKSFMLISFSLTIVQFVFLSVGTMLSQVIPKIKAALPMAIGLGFFFFLIGMVSEITDSKALRCLSPMKYFNGNYILRNHAYERGFVLLSVALIILCGTAGYILYRKKDVPSV